MQPEAKHFSQLTAEGGLFSPMDTDGVWRASGRDGGRLGVCLNHPSLFQQPHSGSQSNTFQLQRVSPSARPGIHHIRGPRHLAPAITPLPADMRPPRLPGSQPGGNGWIPRACLKLRNITFIQYLVARPLPGLFPLPESPLPLPLSKQLIRPCFQEALEDCSPHPPTHTQAGSGGPGFFHLVTLPCHCPRTDLSS